MEVHHTVFSVSLKIILGRKTVLTLTLFSSFKSFKSFKIKFKIITESKDVELLDLLELLDQPNDCDYFRLLTTDGSKMAIPKTSWS